MQSLRQRTHTKGTKWSTTRRTWRECGILILNILCNTCHIKARLTLVGKRTKNY